jgi:hypothetical protein
MGIIDDFVDTPVRTPKVLPTVVPWFSSFWKQQFMPLAFQLFPRPVEVTDLKSGNGARREVRIRGVGGVEHLDASGVRKIQASKVEATISHGELQDSLEESHRIGEGRGPCSDPDESLNIHALLGSGCPS